MGVENQNLDVFLFLTKKKELSIVSLNSSDKRHFKCACSTEKYSNPNAMVEFLRLHHLEFKIPTAWKLRFEKYKNIIPKLCEKQINFSPASADFCKIASKIGIINISHLF